MNHEVVFSIGFHKLVPVVLFFNLLKVPVIKYEDRL